MVAAVDIPVIDIAALRDGKQGAAADVGQAMLAAAEHLGFFYVSGHGVDDDVVRRAGAEARAFFRAPLDDKLAVSVDHRHRGFLRMGEATMHGAKLPDLKESFVYGMETAAGDPQVSDDNPFLGDNRWPPGNDAFRDALSEWFNAAQDVGVSLLRAFAASLALDEGAFVSRFDRPISRGAAVFYPPQAGIPDGKDPAQFGVGPHTDFGCITIVHQDPVGGLEVRNRSGEWVVATPIPGTFVVNVGDLLARWTNNRFASTPHRVVNRSGRERLSLAVFVDPDFETLIDASVAASAGDAVHYEPVRCGDYVLGRYAGAFAYRQG